jgi:hypothetical protein
MDETAKTTGQNAEAEQSAIEEKFPRIAKELCERWGKLDYGACLNSLVFDMRGGRQGFPPDVSSELIMLHGMLEFQAQGDVWNRADNRT